MSSVSELILNLKNIFLWVILFSVNQKPTVQQVYSDSQMSEFHELALFGELKPHSMTSNMIPEQMALMNKWTKTIQQNQFSWTHFWTNDKWFFFFADTYSTRVVWFPNERFSWYGSLELDQGLLWTGCF